MSDHLQELSEAGVSIWLDDLSRERIETGNLAELIKNDNIVGVTTNPSIFAAALAEGERYDDQVRELAAEGADVDKTVFALTTTDVRNACDVMRARLRRHQRGRRPRVHRGRPGPGLRHRRDLRLRQGAVEGGRPAQPVHQDPGDHRGRTRNHRHARRGHQRQRHADLRPRPLPGRDGGLPRRSREGEGGRPRPLRDPLGRLVLRLPRRHRDRQPAEQDGRLRRAPRQGRCRQRAAGLRGLREVLQRRALGPRSRPPAPTPNDRCGPRPASRTPTTRTRCTSTTWSSRTPSTRCRRRPSRRSRTTARSRATRCGRTTTTLAR